MEAPESGARSQQEWKLRSLAVVLALATVAALVCAGINFSQRARFTRPYDGIDWDRTDEGVQARVVWQDTPGDRAGIRAGYLLLSIDGHPIERPLDVTKLLFRAQPGTRLTYQLRRPGPNQEPFTTTVITIPQPDPFSLRGFLELVGVLYLAIGVFVLFKRWNAPHAVHFYLFCLTSFVFYSFAYSGKFNNFDWTIYWSDVVARLLAPALFLHFALAFPEPKRWFRGRRKLFALVYLPAAGLLVWHAVGVGASLLPRSLEQLNWFDQIELGYVAVVFFLAALVFELTYWQMNKPILIQQMKWITRGTWLAVVPFTAFYVIPFFLGYIPNIWMKLSTLALVFIPLTFGYAIIRYRLMDVDIIFRRGVAYTLATAAIAGIYFGLAVTVAELFQTRQGFGTGGVVIAIIIAAVLFQPIKDWTQQQLDRLFYRERFDYRRTLEGFGRELSSEVHLEKLLAKLLDRLGHTLPVARMAILLENENEPGSFRLARGQGFGPGATGTAFHPKQLPEPSHLPRLLDSAHLGGLFPPDERRRLEELGLQMLIPCRIQNRTIAFLALGRPEEGTLVTSEDLALLHTLSDYMAIALENARLYQRVEQKAAQVAQLKEFSENILESSSVGLVAVDPGGRVESWNTSMEKLTGRPRQQALGRSFQQVFPAALVSALEARGEDSRSTLYKFSLARADGGRRITNVVLAPLVSKEGAPIGRLLLFDDITDRVHLESQLLQAEKLSSVGLLAAGVAHEVNTPLAVISNYAQMLAKQFPAEDKRAALVEKIIKQTFRASEIISGLLNFSRTAKAEMGAVDVNRILRDTLALVEPQLRSGKVRVETALANSLPSIQGDPGKLQQVFLNLLFNARDAMPQGGRLTVRTAQQDARVQVEIHDTGVGIPPDDLSKIYDPFFTTKATARGTGLGLAVSYGIIQEHHGTIQVNSRPGEGTVFLLDFPRLAGQAAEAPSRLPASRLEQKG